MHLEDDQTRVVEPTQSVPRSETQTERTPREPLEPGTQVGRYVILHAAGAGGMGEVYGAYDPELDRKIAVKLLPSEDRGGVESTDAEARLLREAQAMAKLSHPNTAAVYDVGTWRDQVFIAMEFIDGATLRDWLGARARRWQEVVEVVLSAGRGLAAAHAAGLIHRDFKPTNVMIRRDGVVRVLDFGLARRIESATTPGPGRDSAILDSLAPAATGGPSGAASGRGSLDGQLTRTGLVTGTPAYMAPEQFVGHELDERTDQFAFCVALYEGLYGERPFAGKGLREIAKQVHLGRVRPAPASSRVPPRLRRVLLRGLAVDPLKRHASMAALIAEIERVARPRWRRAVPAVATVSGVAAVGLAIAMPRPVEPQCTGAADELAGVWDPGRVRAAFEAVDRPYSAAMLAGVEGRIDAWAGEWVQARTDACEDTRVRGEQSEALLDRRIACYDGRLAELRALTDVLAKADATVVEKAVDLTGKLGDLSTCDAAIVLDQRLEPPAAEIAADVASIREALATAKLIAAAGKWQQGLPEAEALVERARSLGYLPLVAEALLQLGSFQYALGKSDVAEETLTEALLLAERTAHDEMELRVRLSLASVTGMYLARPDDGREHASFAEALAHRVHAGRDVAGMIPLVTGMLAYRTGDHEAAAQAFERARSEREAAFGPDHPEVASMLINLGAAQVGLARLDEAKVTFERAVEIYRAVHGEAHPVTGHALNGLGLVHLKARRYAQALEINEQALAIWSKALPENHPDIAKGHHNIGTILVQLGRHEEALRSYEAALSAKLASVGPDHPSVALSRSNVADLLNRMGRHDEALEHGRAAVAIAEAALGPEHLDLGAISTTLGEAELGSGHPGPARAHLERALTILSAHPGQDVDLAGARMLLARTLWAQGEQARAQSLAEQAHATYESLGDPFAAERDGAAEWLAHPTASI